MGGNTSTKDVAANIKRLADALTNNDPNVELKLGHDLRFEGAIASTDDQGWVELDKKIQAIHKASAASSNETV